jgi:hypothetical protein
MASGRGLKSSNRKTVHQSTVFWTCSDQLVFRFWANWQSPRPADWLQIVIRSRSDTELEALRE